MKCCCILSFGNQSVSCGLRLSFRHFHLHICVFVSPFYLLISRLIYVSICAVIFHCWFSLFTLHVCLITFRYESHFVNANNCLWTVTNVVDYRIDLGHYYTEALYRKYKKRFSPSSLLQYLYTFRNFKSQNLCMVLSKILGITKQAIMCNQTRTYLLMRFGLCPNIKWLQEQTHRTLIDMDKHSCCRVVVFRSCFRPSKANELNANFAYSYVTYLKQRWHK